MLAPPHDRPAFECSVLERLRLGRPREAGLGLRPARRAPRRLDVIDVRGHGLQRAPAGAPDRVEVGCRPVGRN
jgi:hypothetical protein